MSKKLKNMKWESVSLEGFPLSTDNFDGFVGLEECTTYGLDKESKYSKKIKPQKKRKSPPESDNKEVPNKKVKPNPDINRSKPTNNTKNKVPKTIKHNQEGNETKFANGFFVESHIKSATPSLTNKKSSENSNVENVEGTNTRERNKRNERRKKNKDKRKIIKENKPEPTKTNAENVKTKLKKPKLGEENTQSSDLIPEDMLTWAEFKLQEPIIKALMELGFKKPTKIQQLTLPAAIHGRRDILGAAETGSGKTLAFGLPILSGILKLKEKAESKGIEVYDIPYKKGAAKKKPKKIKKMKVVEVEDSGDGYSPGDDDDASSSEERVIKPRKKKKFKKAEDYLQEKDVPIRKKDTSICDTNDSDDENYIHLSDMLDSDDLADNSDEDVDQSDDENKKDGVLADVDQSDDLLADEDQCDDVLADEDKSDNEKEVDDNSGDEIDGDVSIGDGNEESDEMGEEGSDEDDTGTGCVKEINNLEFHGHLVMKTGKPLYALILTPTRELAIQISRHLMAAAKYTGIKVATIVGGMAHVKQERLLRGGPEIVVATPGRLWELVNQGQQHLQQLDTVKFLAIDETDRMIERGHFEEVTPLLERMNASPTHSAARQHFVFSATLTLVHDLPTHMKGKKVTKNGKILNRKVEKMTSEQKVKRLVDLLGMTEPKVVDITQQNLGTAESLTECKIMCAMEHKDAYLFYILKRHPGRTIVFCNSIGSVKRLATLLTILKCTPLPLHAGMPQRQRLKNLERFRDNPHGVLIATDVAARGLDIPLVDHVIQYQVPRTAENYIHRSGRTARAEREGINVLMIEPAEAYLYSKLCLTLNRASEVPTFPVAQHLLHPLKELVVAARALDGLELRKRRSAQARGWKEKAAQDMDIIIDDKDCPTEQADPTIDRALKALRKDLDRMLSKPMFPKGFSFKYPTLNDPMALSMPQENALQVMKNAIESGEMKNKKRQSKNAPLLKLGKGVHRNKKQKKK